MATFRPASHQPITAFIEIPCPSTFRDVNNNISLQDHYLGPRASLRLGLPLTQSLPQHDSFINKSLLPDPLQNLDSVAAQELSLAPGAVQASESSPGAPAGVTPGETLVQSLVVRWEPPARPRP